MPQSGLRSFFLAVLLSLLASVPVQAQNWPDKPVRILIGYSPGGTVDGWSRMAARRFEDRFKQPFVVENRPGASATLATTAIAQGQTDGYLFSFLSLTTQGRNFHKNVTYDTMTDFEPVAGLYSAPYAFAANTQAPFKTVKEFVDYAKANPGKVNFGAGVTTFQIVGTLMQKTWGVKTEMIPYKGQAPTLTALVANEVQVTLDQPAVLVPMTQAGKIRVLASTSERRMAHAPDVPTMAELGYPSLTFAGSAMFWARRGFPKDAADKLLTASAEMLRQPEFVERMRIEAAVPLSVSHAELWDRYVRDAAFMAEAAKAANYQPQ